MIIVKTKLEEFTNEEEKIKFQLQKKKFNKKYYENHKDIILKNKKVKEEFKKLCKCYNFF